MKKIISLAMALAMLLTLLAGCTGGNNDVSEPTDASTEATDTTTEATDPEVAGPASALEILENAWAGVDGDFFVMGGDYSNPVDGAPGAVDVTMTDYLNATLLVPEAELANVTEAASLMHAMMANNFTCGVFRVADAAAFAEAMHDSIANNPWICGMPESLLIVTIDGGYVLAAFGIDAAMTPFQTSLTEAYPDAQVVYSEAIAG